MATPKHSGSSQAGARLTRGRNGGGGLPPLGLWLWRAGLFGLTVAAGLLVWNWSDFREGALVGTAYGARIGCSCHYVGGRNLADCRKDFEPGMALVSLWDDPESHSITARVPLIASQTARFRPGQGCVLDSWR